MNTRRNEPDIDTKAIGRMPARQLEQELAEWDVIDVREPEEWVSGVIPGARLMPLGSVLRRAGELDPTVRYAVVCAHGHRSLQACLWLANRGLQVTNVEGGMAAWRGSLGQPDADAARRTR